MVVPFLSQRDWMRKLKGLVSGPGAVLIESEIRLLQHVCLILDGFAPVLDLCLSGISEESFGFFFMITLFGSIFAKWVPPDKVTE